MKQVTFITGNQNKADYLAENLDMEIPHLKVDVEEIQSMDLREVVSSKLEQAYEVSGTPVLVEDVSLEFTSLGRLPGTFIKWFIQEMGMDNICKKS